MGEKSRNGCSFNTLTKCHSWEEGGAEKYWDSLTSYMISACYRSFNLFQVGGNYFFTMVSQKAVGNYLGEATFVLRVYRGRFLPFPLFSIKVSPEEATFHPW